MASAVKVTVGPIDGSMSAVVEVKPNTETRPAAVVPSSSFDYLPPWRSLPACRKHDSHLPKSRARKQLKEYSLFKAAEDGCLRCVRRKLEVEKDVDPHVTSETNNYTAKDFAKYAVDKHIDGADAVVKYLEKYWPGIP